jgi:thiamine biosynthesis lipoprotein
MKLKRRAFLASTAAAACSIGLPRGAAAAGEGETRVIGGPAFGSYFRAVLPRDADGHAARAAIAKTVAEIDDALSPYQKGSEISRFNAASADRWRPIGRDTAQVMAEGLRIAGLTGGAFDPTVGPIAGRYGFGPFKGERHGTFLDIACRDRHARKTVAGASFDPCGIAKGHALDRIAQRLMGLGIPAFLVELGGEIIARGRHPSGRPWQAGVERPAPGAMRFQHILRLEDMALATSGDREAGYAVDGKRYSHIINPRTGRPMGGNVASVSVIHRRAMTADALATGLAAMGPEAGLAFAERERLAALYILREGDRLISAESPAFAQYRIV